jgi:dolichol kinase
MSLDFWTGAAAGFAVGVITAVVILSFLAVAAATFHWIRHAAMDDERVTTSDTPTADNVTTIHRKHGAP